jgi:DNA-binding NtrC family response regulator
MSQTLLICDDDADIRLALSLLFTSQGYQILEADCAKAVITHSDRHKPDLILLDMNFSRDTTSGNEGLELVSQLQSLSIPIILMTAWGSIELAVKGLQLGAGDFIEKPWQRDKLLNSVKQQLKLGQLTNENKALKQLLIPQTPVNWVAKSASMHQVNALIEQIAPTDANILILGENGTGKSLLAQRIHQLSDKKQQPLIDVNMAAIPANLFESELFGHQKGAFTDAKESRVGRFQLSENSTLFLDEIGTLPLDLQPKLLRVLETGQFEVLGSSKTLHSNARIISATNADLSDLVKNGQFRQDLLYRLNTFVIELPPLRKRIDDIGELAKVFLAKFCKKYNKDVCKLSDDAQGLLLAHPWPGNVRELQHVIERAVLLSQGREIKASQILLDQSIPLLAPHMEDQQLADNLSLADNEIKLINLAIKRANGQIIGAAQLLGISRNSLYRRLDKYEINYDT